MEEMAVDQMSDREDLKAEPSFDRTLSVTDEEPSRQPAAGSTLMALSDAVDEFFDVPEPSDDEAQEKENCWSESPDMCYVVCPNLFSIYNYYFQELCFMAYHNLLSSSKFLLKIQK